GYNFARNNPDRLLPEEEENHWMSQELVAPISNCLFTAKGGYDKLSACLNANKVDLAEGVIAALKEEYPDLKFPLPPAIIVMPDGDSSFYMNRADGAKQWPPLDGPEFFNGFRKGGSGQYETYVAYDLVKYIDSKYRTIADREHRGIGGFSMGGIGSMNLLLGHPDVFKSVTSLSSPFTLTDMLTDPFSLSFMKGSVTDIPTVMTYDANPNKDSKIDKKFLMANDPYYRLKNLQRDDVAIYFDAGAGDTFAGRNNFETFRKFQALLDKKGLKSSPAAHVIPGTEFNAKGMHTGRYWRSRTGVLIAFHLKAFGMVK
ncbi:MAG TPA: alpha/beta hydrolase-fold protein, partial [bacterium]|nr:alpha/beta hydrolase-fold protein [bacterium]